MLLKNLCGGAQGRGQSADVDLGALLITRHGLERTLRLARRLSAAATLRWLRPQTNTSGSCCRHHHRHSDNGYAQSCMLPVFLYAA